MNDRWVIEAWPGGSPFAVAVDSRYAEEFWLPTIGPSGLWMLRRLNRMIGQQTTDSFLSAAVGLGHQASPAARSAYRRTMGRLEQFRLIELRPAPAGPFGRMAVRTALMPLRDKDLERLPPELRELHQDRYGSPRMQEMSRID